MNPIESRIYSAAASAAAEITGADIPPLRLRSRRAGSRRRGTPARTGGALGTRRWLAALAAAAGVMVVIAAVLVLGRGSAAGHHAGSRPATRPGPATGRAQAARNTLEAGALDSYFPATGAQYTAGLAFHWTRLKISAQIFGSCMARAGFPQPPFSEPESSYLQAFPDNSQFPDLAQRARLDSMSGPYYINKGPVAPASAAGRRAARPCTAASNQPFTAIDKIAIPLENPWLGVVTAIQSSAPVQAMQPAFSACLQAHGIPASYAQQKSNVSNPLFDGFFGWMDHLGQTATSTREQSTEDHRWTPVFVRCARPTVTVVERLQLSQRASFFTRHARQISEIKALAAGLLNAPGH
jgi:hypothetical protein